MVLAIGLITDNLIIPIGYEWKAAAAGSAVILGIIAGMSAIVWALSKMKKTALIKGLATIAAIEVLLWSLDKALDPYIELALRIGKDWKAISKGGLAIAGTITAWGVLMGAIGFIADKFATQLVIGAATVAGIAAVLWAIAEMMPTYINTALMMYKDWKAISKGGAIIAATITAWGLIFTAIGALVFGPQVLVLAAGAGVVTGISAVLFAISKLLPSYIKTARLVHDNYAIIKSAGDKLPGIFGQIGKMMAKIGLIYGNPISMIAIGMGGAAVAAIAASIWEISKVMNPFITLMKRVADNNITNESIKTFTALFVGKNSVADAIEKIVKNMADVGIIASMKAGFIANRIRPVFEVLSMFIHVITQSLNMKFASEWDKNGKPIAYQTVTPTMMGQAGITISVAFGTFLTELGRGLDALKPSSIYAIRMIGHALKPVISAVSMFVDTIVKVLSKGVPCEWDKDGKPTKWQPIDMTRFADAATHIANGFGTFLTTLGPHLQRLGPRAAYLISLLGKGIKPVMEAVATFTDSVMGILTGKTITYTDDNGKEVTKFIKIDAEKFKAAGKVVADSFTGFIDAIWDTFKKGEYEVKHTFSANENKNHLVDVINGLENIGTVVDAVNQFADLIIKVAAKQKEIDFVAVGRSMAEMITTLINKLGTVFGTEENLEKVDNIVNGMSSFKKISSHIESANKSMAKALKLFRETGVTKEEITQMYDIFVTMLSSEQTAVMKAAKPHEFKNLQKTLEKINSSAKLLKKFAALGKKKEEISEGVALFLNQAVELNKLKEDKFKLHVSDVATLPRYMGYLVKAAKELRKLAGIMNDADMTVAVNAFVKDISALTEPKLLNKVDLTKRSMRLFSKDIKSFSMTIADSQKTVIKFTSNMKKATDSLRKFDDAIITRERERNQALHAFAEKVQEIANSVGNLKTQIETLDENKIMSNFRGISSLFEMVKGVGNSLLGGSGNSSASSPAQNNAQKTEPAKTAQTKPQNKGAVAQSVPMLMPGQKMMITMNFQNTSFTGFMEATVL